MAIITKHKDTTGAAAAALEVGELGVNTVDGTLSVGTAGGNVDLVSGSQDLPTGTNGQTLRNDSGDWESTSDLVVDSSGNVGIGTAAPTGKVDIVDASVSNLSLQGSSGNWIGVYSGGFDPIMHCLSGSNMRFGHSTDKNAGGFSEDMTIDSSGNVGIGNTSPNVKLVVAGSTRVTTSFIAPSGDDHTAPAYTWNGDQDTGMFRVTDNIIGFTTGATERMRIDSSGNVGIQTPSAFNNTDDRLSIDCGFSTPNKGITLFGSNVDGGGSLTFAEGSVDGEYAVITGQRDGNSASNCFLSFKVSSDWDSVAATERMRIDSSGVVTLGGASGDRVAGTGNSIGQAQIHKFHTLTQAQYDALGTPNANTLYIIV